MAQARVTRGMEGGIVPPNGKQRRVVLEERRAKVAELLVKGYTVAQICKELNTNNKAVTWDILTLRERWEKQADDDYRASRRRELMDLEMQEKELWEAWEKSKAAETEKGVTETTTGEGGQPSRTKSARTRSRYGDVRLMQQILAVCHSRRKLLGLDAEESVDTQENTGVLVVPGRIDPEEWAEAVKAQTEAVKRRIPDLRVVS